LKACVLTSLPPFPAVAKQLLTLTAQDNCTIPQVAGLVRSDAAFAAEVLRLANSALLGLRYEVTSILHGVSVLGMDRLRALVMTVALRDMVSSARHEDLLRRCWRHNLAGALIGEGLAELFWIDRAEAYTAGLLHDLGTMALVALYPQQYARLLERRSVERPIQDQERDELGASSTEAGIWLAEEWGLPSRIRHAIALPADATVDRIESLPELARVGCRLSSALAFGLLPVDKPATAVEMEALVPCPVNSRLQDRLAELAVSVPVKINAFEGEFLS
jgi:HD-like signal output (HDOD) protein